MSDITEEDVMKYCYSRNLMLVTRESLEYMHRPIVIETMNKNAIPVEWIEEWIKTCIPHYDYDRMTYIADVYEMLEDWEEEKSVKTSERNYDSDEEYEEQMRCLDETDRCR